VHDPIEEEKARAEFVEEQDKRKRNLAMIEYRISKMRE